MPIHAVTTRAELELLVVRGQPETVRLEFKSTIHGWNAPKSTPGGVRQKAQRELCRDFSQLANASGGHIVYGVAETTGSDGLRLAGDWMPVSDAEGMKAWIEQAITNCCVPSTFTKEVHAVEVDGGRVIVATIQPSRATVYVWDRDAKTIECMTRTSTGKKYMNPNEMERHHMDGTRAAKLAFDDAWATPNRQEGVVLADGVWTQGKHDTQRYMGVGPLSIGPRNEATFELRISVDNIIRTLAIPYSLVTHVWLDGQQRLTLMLGARLVYEGGGFSLRLLG